MRFVDPILEKLHHVLPREPFCGLDEAISNWGQRRDYEALLERIFAMREASHLDPVLVDLTPLDRPGRKDQIGAFLRTRVVQERSVFLVPENSVGTAVEEAARTELVSYVVVDKRGGLEQVHLSKTHEGLQPVFERLRAQGTSISEIRRALSHARLLERALAAAVRAEDKQAADVPRKRVAGDDLLCMTNGMLVSAFLNIKSFLVHPEDLVDLAFDVAYASAGSLQQARDRGAFLPLVAPNNTSYLLALAHETLTGAPACVIDKVGPIPSTRVTSEQVSRSIRGEEVALLVDVSATGGEIDRALMAVWNQGAIVQQVVCCYWLEVGQCQLLGGIPMIALCRPRRDLGYVYRSAPAEGAPFPPTSLFDLLRDEAESVEVVVR